MKKFRQRLAVTLAAALVAGLMTAPAYADEAQKLGWKQEGGVWHYYSGEGKLQRNKEKKIRDKWYAFDEDGRMYENELFVSPSSERVDMDQDGNPINNRFAFRDGHLAEATWVKLNKEGRLYTSGDAAQGGDLFWYYFNNGNDERAGEMLYNQEKTINKAVYRFYEDGHMYSHEWYGEAPDEDERLKADTYYYQFDGEKAVNKWLPLDNYWYHFDGDGIVDEIKPLEWDDSATATDSNARPPYPLVESVEAVGDKEVNAVVGEPVKLNFKVTLASGSNAIDTKFTKKAHDIWGTPTLTGRLKTAQAKVEDNGLCTVEYTPKSLEEEKVSLFVDGVESDPITVTPGLENAGSKEDAIGTLIDSLVNPELDSDVSANDALGAISKVMNQATDEERQSIQENLAKSGNYTALENMYIMENQIEVKPVDVDEKAQESLDVNRITMVGGALNASASVGLKVTGTDVPSASVAPQAQSYKMKLAFDFVIEVDGTEATELTFPAWIQTPVPKGFDASKMKIFHIHNGQETEVPFTIKDGDLCEFMATKLSPYVFVQNDNNSNNNSNNNNTNNNQSNSSGSSDSSASTRSAGQWVLSAAGWWYDNGDGSYPVNTWSYLEYNGVKDWYRFDQNGYLKTGWFTDEDGRIYYLNPVSNGFLGALRTGWQMIDGCWYYFNAESNGYKGMLLVNTVTPDGYHVNESGQRIE